MGIAAVLGHRFGPESSRTHVALGRRLGRKTEEPQHLTPQSATPGNEAPESEKLRMAGNLFGGIAGMLVGGNIATFAALKFLPDYENPVGEFVAMIPYFIAGGWCGKIAGGVAGANVGGQVGAWLAVAQSGS